MKLSHRVASRFAGLFACAFLLSGCSVVTDLVSPSLLNNLGVDPETVRPTPGSVVVTFNNTTTLTTTFLIGVSDDPRDATANLKAVTGAAVDGGATRNRVLDCPVGVVTPVSAVVDAPAQGDPTGVDFAGAGLVYGRDFTCGDVIELKLSRGGAGLVLEARVIPGR